MPRLKMDYTKARIYKIVNDVDDYIYIGSCCCELPKRFYKHKQKAQLAPDRRVYKHITDIGGWDRARIVLIERCSEEISNDEELCKREQFYQDAYIKEIGREKSLNTYKAHSGINWEDPDREQKFKKQYREENKKEIAEKEKKYREDNPDKDKARRKNYYENNREIILDKCKEYIKYNPEVISKRKKEVRQNNKEKMSEYLKEYRENNLEKIKEYSTKKLMCQMCKCEVARSGYSKHKQSIKHIENFILW